MTFVTNGGRIVDYADVEVFMLGTRNYMGVPVLARVRSSLGGTEVVPVNYYASEERALTRLGDLAAIRRMALDEVEREREREQGTTLGP